jgi:hypothetical protein
MGRMLHTLMPAKCATDLLESWCEIFRFTQLHHVRMICQPWPQFPYESLGAGLYREGRLRYRSVLHEPGRKTNTTERHLFLEMAECLQPIRPTHLRQKQAYLTLACEVCCVADDVSRSANQLGFGRMFEISVAAIHETPVFVPSHWEQPSPRWDYQLVLWNLNFHNRLSVIVSLGIRRIQGE